ncbi:hypothetical protein TWF696_007486 [Orbilia brochopaga]|uniref:Uncharacterized protein n=1 Tax=Orbilia brochopaga TaxID=3140254 RepID=A0AAV9ULW0_9PEZI
MSSQAAQTAGDSSTATPGSAQRIIRKRVSSKDTTFETLVAQSGSALAEQVEAHDSAKASSTKRSESKKVLSNEQPNLKSVSIESPTIGLASLLLSSPGNGSSREKSKPSIWSMENPEDYLKYDPPEYYKTEIPNRRLTPNECAEILKGRLERNKAICNTGLTRRLPPTTASILDTFTLTEDQKMIKEVRDKGRSIGELPLALALRQAERDPAFLDEYEKEIEQIISTPAEELLSNVTIPMSADLREKIIADICKGREATRKAIENHQRTTALRAAAYADEPPPGYVRPPVPTEADWEAFLRKRENPASGIPFIPIFPNWGRGLEEALGISHIKDGDNIYIVPPGMKHPSAEVLRRMGERQFYKDHQAVGLCEEYLDSIKLKPIWDVKAMQDALRKAGLDYGLKRLDAMKAAGYQFKPNMRQKPRNRTRRGRVPRVRRPNLKKFVPQLDTIMEEDEEEDQEKSRDKGKDRMDEDMDDAANSDDEDSEEEDWEEEGSEDEDDSEEDGDEDSEDEDSEGDEEDRVFEFDAYDTTSSEDSEQADDPPKLKPKRARVTRHHRIEDLTHLLPPFPPGFEDRMMKFFNEFGLPMIRKHQREYEQKQLKKKGAKKGVKPAVTIAGPSTGVKRRVSIHTLRSQSPTPSGSHPSLQTEPKK